MLPQADQRPGVRYAWRGPSLLVVEGDGTAGGHELSGFYFRQTRHVSRLGLRVGCDAPHPCSIAEVSPAELELTYIHPEVTRGGGGGSGSGGAPAGGGLLYRNFDVRLRYRVRPASLEATVVLTSRWQDDVTVEVAWELDADFATVDEAQFADLPRDRTVSSRAVACGVEFTCDACGVPLGTRVRGTGAPWRFSDGRLAAPVRLRRGCPVELGLRVEALDPTDPIDAHGEAEREVLLAAWLDDVVRLHAPGDAPFVDFTSRAAADLAAFALLEGPRDEWLTPGAGVPLYQALWARDALTAAWQAGLLDRGRQLEHVLTTLTRTQGEVVAPERDEEPGRILNQAKRDLHSRTGASGFARYYADVASPFMFIIGLGYHYALTGDRAHAASRYEAALRVLDWAERDGDRSGRGYVEYLTRAPHGPTHQAWKDSENAVVDAHGEQVAPPVASCEIQGYWYVSLQFMAVLSAVLGHRRRALELWQRARALQARFDRDFWLDDEGFIAFGLDAAGQPIRALTSNAGQCLASGIVRPERMPRLVRRLFEPDLFSGWGIRTLATGNPAYHPLDYHLGSVWPVENATIVFGLRRYGFDDRAAQLAGALYDLARLWPHGRTPECVGGYARADGAHPGAYPRANRPQTWNQSTWPLLLQSLLGLVPFAPLRLLLVDPILPPWLPEVTLRGLRVGDSSVSLRFRRNGDGSAAYEVIERSGRLRIVRQPWLESFSADVWERAGGLLQSALAD